MIDWLLGNWPFGSSRRSYVRARFNEEDRRRAEEADRGADVERALSELDGPESFVLGTLADGKETVLLQGNIVSQTRPALSPDGKLLAFTWPATTGWELRLMSVERPGPSILLVSRPGGRPLVPSWSFGGDWIYFSEGDERQVPHLYRVPAIGGSSRAKDPASASSCPASSSTPCPR